MTRGEPGAVSCSARCNVSSSTARPRNGISDAPRKCSLLTAGFRPSNRNISTGSGIPFNARAPKRLGIAIGAEQGLAFAAQANLAGQGFLLDPAGQMHGEAGRILLDHGAGMELARDDLAGVQADPDHGSVRQLGDGGAHGKRGMAGEHRVPLARMRHPERGLEPVAQGAKHRAVVAVDRTRHDHHDRMQEIHRRFGVHAGDARGRTGDVREQDGRLFALARHVGDAGVRFSRLTARGAESGRFREIPPAAGAYRSEGDAAGYAEPARGLILVSACPALHRETRRLPGSPRQVNIKACDLRGIVPSWRLKLTSDGFGQLLRAGIRKRNLTVHPPCLTCP